MKRNSWALLFVTLIGTSCQDFSLLTEPKEGVVEIASYPYRYEIPPLLTAPTLFKASDNYSSIVYLSWDFVPYADSYIVRCMTDHQHYELQLPASLVDTTAHTYTYDLQVTPNSYYEYEVFAIRSEKGIVYRGPSATVRGRTLPLLNDNPIAYPSAKMDGRYIDLSTHYTGLLATLESIYNQDMSDGEQLLFMIDNTGSMEEQIKQVKRLFANGQIYSLLPKGTMVGVFDFQNQSKPAILQPTTNYQEVSNYVAALKLPNVPNDVPESYKMGLYQAIGYTKWLPSSHPTIILIGDSWDVDDLQSQWYAQESLRYLEIHNMSLKFHVIRMQHLN